MTSLATQPDPPARVDVASATRDTFMSYMDQFLAALVEVFPECNALKGMRLEYDVAVTHALTAGLRNAAEEAMIRGYNDAMAPYFAACRARDARVFMDADIAPLNAIDMRSKWGDPSIDDATRACVWSYVDSLNKYCQMYFLYESVPADMMAKIQGVAAGLADKIDGGEMSLGDLNIVKLGQSLVGDIDKAELDQFARGMMGNEQSIASLTSMLHDSGVSLPGI